MGIKKSNATAKNMYSALAQDDTGTSPSTSPDNEQRTPSGSPDNEQRTPSGSPDNEQRTPSGSPDSTPTTPADASEVEEDEPKNSVVTMQTIIGDRVAGDGEEKKIPLRTDSLLGPDRTNSKTSSTANETLTDTFPAKLERKKTKGGRRPGPVDCEKMFSVNKQEKAGLPKQSFRSSRASSEKVQDHRGKRIKLSHTK